MSLTRTPDRELFYDMGEEPTRKPIQDIPKMIGEITFKRVGDGARIDVDGQPLAQRYVYHSPSGLEFGYGGSGPADTALNILALFLPGKEAVRLHQSFKFDHVANIPREGGILPLSVVRDWIVNFYASEGHI